MPCTCHDSVIDLMSSEPRNWFVSQDILCFPGCWCSTTVNCHYYFHCFFPVCHGPVDVMLPGRFATFYKVNSSCDIPIQLIVTMASTLGWVSRSQIVSQNLRSICDKHTIKLRLEKRVTGKDRKALVIHTHAQRTRSIYDDIPTLRVPDGCRRMLAVYEINQR